MKLLIITQKVDANDQLLGFFIGWLERLAKKFEKLTILCLEKGDYALPLNTEVISLGKDRGASKFRQLLNFYSLIFYRRNSYDVVFVHMNPIWMVLGGLPWKILGKKRILWYTHKSVTLRLRLAEKFSDVILTASKESFRLPSKKLVVTGHGIDTELFKPAVITRPLSGGLKLLSVGRISPIKNYGILIDAAKILADEGIDFKVTLVGEPALESDKGYELEIKNKIKELRLDNRFNFAGKVAYKDLPQHYQSHDIFIHLSKTGSLDKTILEAMACGINVLSSNDSSRAFLGEKMTFKEDNPTEIAEKIVHLKNKNYGDDLRSYVLKNHNLNHLINKMSEIITQ